MAYQNLFQTLKVIYSYNHLNSCILDFINQLHFYFIRLSFFLIIFSFFCLHSQVFVDTASFVYANNTYLYVNKDLSLNGNVYLRNQSQLLQGTTGVNMNSGLGNISIFQEGTVNNFQYNYWCSPVGMPSTVSGNRDFGVTRLFRPLSLIESSNSVITSDLDGISNPLTISQRWIYTFTTSNSYSQWNFIGANNTIMPGYGFTMKGTSGFDNLVADSNDGVQNNQGSKQRYDFRGRPNNGIISIPVSADNFTLIGNPYPSAIDLNLLLLDPLNSTLINGQAYFWEQVEVNSHYINAYSGGYGIYTPGAGYTPAAFWNFDSSGNYETSLNGTGSLFERRFLPIGQGFMVKGTSSGNIVMKNTFRVYRKEGVSFNSEFARNNNIEQDIEYFDSIPNLSGIDYTQIRKGFVPQLRIHAMYNDGGIRPTTLGFDPMTTDGYDYGYDGASSSREDAEFFYIIEGSLSDYFVNVTNFDINKKIPVGFRCQSQTNFKVKVVDVLYGFDNNQKVYLHDKVSDIYYDIKDGLFNLTLPSGIFKERFEITFKNSDDILSTTSSEIIFMEIIQNNTSDVLLIQNHENKKISTIAMYDINGRCVIVKENVGYGYQFQVSTSKLSSGVYFVKIRTDEGELFSKKIIVD